MTSLPVVPLFDFVLATFLCRVDFEITLSSDTFRIPFPSQTSSTASSICIGFVSVCLRVFLGLLHTILNNETCKLLKYNSSMNIKMYLPQFSIITPTTPSK